MKWEQDVGCLNTLPQMQQEWAEVASSVMAKFKKTKEFLLHIIVNPARVRFEMVLVRRDCGTTVNLGLPSAYQMQKRTIPKTSIMPHIEMILISTASIWKIKTLRCNYRKEGEGKK